MENYRGKSEDLFVRFHVAEGQQTRVADLKLEGNQALSNAELFRVIGSTAGQPFSDFNVAGDRDNILAIYYDQQVSRQARRLQSPLMDDSPADSMRSKATSVACAFDLSHRRRHAGSCRACFAGWI